MSTVYPEVKALINSRADVRNAAMSNGSALFPGEAANLYRRKKTVAHDRTAKLAWIAAPIAVVVIGGGVLMALPHANTVHSANAKVSRTTVAPAAAARIAAAIAKTVAASEGRTSPQTVTGPVAKRSRATVNPVTQTETRAAAPTLPTAPQPYAAIQGAAHPGVQSGSSAASQPSTHTAPQSATPTAPTPGDFKFTAPPTGPAVASPTVTPSTAATEPVVPTPQAQPQPQG